MGKCEKWTIAYRKRTEGKTLIDDLSTPFVKIPNTWRYWRADPFIVEQAGRTWVFAELYDRPRLKGVLACCELSESGSGKWRVILDEPFHLSYPFVFCHHDQWYMIPESFRAGKIILYKAKEFPFVWERVFDLEDMAAVDSTVVQSPAGCFLITVQVKNSASELVIFKIDDEWTLSEPHIVSEKDDPNVRPAGRVFVQDGKLLRPAQDCTRGYGFALNFMQIHQLDDGAFREKLLRKVLPKDICITGVNEPEGIHTYNFSEHYEVIDYKEYEFGLISKIAGVVKRLRNKIH